MKRSKYFDQFSYFQPMAKYKDLSDDVRHLKDTLSNKWISIISLTAFFSLGVWMLIDPTSPEHQSVEKSTVYLLKEIWSYPTGIIIVAIAAPFMILRFRDVSMLSGPVWIRLENGYYFFDKKVRKSGLAGMYDGEDLVVFYPEGNRVICLKDYETAGIGVYRKASATDIANLSDAYWNADSSGFSVVHEGKFVANPEWEKRGDDLVVTSPETKKQFFLKDYANLKDNKLRKAKVMGRNEVIG